jgi:translin
MKNLEKVVESIETELDEKDHIREVALKSSRAVVRLAGSILKGMHREEDQKAALADLRDEVSRLNSLVAEHPDLANAGYVEAALQEYAEVAIVLSLLEVDDVPSPQEIGIRSVPFLLGLGDTVGELRRFCLDALKRGDIKRANHFLDRMEDLSHALMRFDYPDAIVAVRKKQDVARSLLEKTRGEVAVAASNMELRDKLDGFLKR